MKYNELRRTLTEKTKEIKKLQSGTDTSTVSTVDCNTVSLCTYIVFQTWEFSFFILSKWETFFVQLNIQWFGSFQLWKVSIET